MYYDNDPDAQAQLENERILRLIAANPAEAYNKDPAVRAAFEESLRQLAEDIVAHNPGLAHILLGMGGSQVIDAHDSIHGQN